MSTKTEVSVKNFKMSITSAVPDILKKLTEETLKRAVEAGGFVVRSHAIINISTTFKRVHGVRGLSKIVVDNIKSDGKSASADVHPTAIYGRIQELGGTVRPSKAKLLSWVDPDSGERRFAKKVVLPPRPYLGPAVENNTDEIMEAIKNRLVSDIKSECL